MSEKKSRLLEAAGKFKYPLIVLAAGLLLMLMPTGKGSAAVSPESYASDEELRLEFVLSAVEGAGEACVLLSEEGAVIVCEGADNAWVRLEVTQAVRTFTGFGGDRITVLKIADNSVGEASK